MRILTAADFQPLQGESFTVDGVEGAVLRLTHFAALTHSQREGGGFRLELEGPAEPLLPQAMYALRREGEVYEVFLVPVAQAGGVTTYESIFN